MEIICAVKVFDAISVFGNHMLRCIKIMEQVCGERRMGESIQGNWAEMDASGLEIYYIF